MIRHLLLICALPSFALAALPRVTAVHAPDAGIQPQAAVDSAGKVHLIYLKGEERACDVFYVTSADGGRTWAKPIRVNSQPGTAVAVGTVRGAQLAIGKGDRPHVAWFGSKEAIPTGPGGATPMLYARLNDAKTAFETQRNLITTATGLDGGGSIAADTGGNVYVAWHAPIPGRTGEANRTVWLATSKNDGATFAPEVQMLGDNTGVCGCCGLKLGLDPKGNPVAVYRAANTETRDMYLLAPSAGGMFSAAKIDTLAIKTCPMSTSAIARAQGNRTLVAWETGGQVSLEAFDANNPEGTGSTPAPGSGRNRKHPALAVDRDGYILLTWDEGTAWKQGGTLHWQLFDRALKPIDGTAGSAPGLAVWSLSTAFPTPDGFVIVY